MTDRFDLEQEIMGCWNVVDDLGKLLRECERIENVETLDYMMNLVLGLKSVYEMRFNHLWNTFEDTIKNGNI